MIETEHPSIIDFRDSYSIEESVAKMLGWMHGPKRLETVNMDERGLIPEHLPHLYSLLYSLDDHLDELQERARLELLDATNAYALAKGTAGEHAAVLSFDEKDQAKNNWDKVVDIAHFYKTEIKKELAKKEFSELKIDQPTTDETGDTHITLESLDDWAKKFGVTIIDVPEGLVVTTKKSHEQMAQAANIEVKHESTEAPIRIHRIRQRHNSLSRVIDPILETMPNPTAERVMAELRKLIGNPDNFTIIKTVYDSIEWDKGNGKFGTLTHKLLKGRIAEWQELPLA